MKIIFKYFTTIITCLCVLITLVSCKEHKHTLNEGWEKDINSHWHSCSGCDETIDFGSHNFGNYQLKENECIETRSCDVCGITETKKVNHTYGEWTILTDGNAGRECSHCHTIEYVTDYYVKGVIKANNAITNEATEEGKLKFNKEKFTATITLELSVGDSFKVGSKDGYQFNAKNVTLIEGLEGTDYIECKIAGTYTITISDLNKDSHKFEIVYVSNSSNDDDSTNSGNNQTPDQGDSSSCEHTVTDVTYLWSEDNSKCTASFKCSKCNDDVTEEVSTTYLGTANCTQAGKITYTATFLNTSFTVQTKEINTEALGHDIVEHPAQNATCTEKGWAAYEMCSRCEYTTYEEIPALGHNLNFGDETTSCENCELSAINYYLKASFLPTTWNHSNEGKFIYNLSDNSMILNVLITDGDTFKVGTYNGWEFNSTNSIANLEQYFVEAETDQNIKCIKTGVYKIIVQNNSISIKYLSETCNKHEEIKGVYISNSTGHWTFCVNCRMHKFETEPHTYKNNSSCDIDCEVCGYIRGNTSTHTYDNNCDAECNSCGFKRTPSNHEVSSTCDEICNVCNGKVVPTTDHIYDNACDAECNKCGNTRTPEEHKYTGEFEIKNEDGHAHKCDVCQFEQTILAHTPGDEATETTAQVCTDCGYIIVPATSHECKASTKWEKDETKHWNYCVNCTEKFNEGAHEYDDETCDSTCNICGYVRIVTHEFDNACDSKCNNCEYTRTTTHNYVNKEHEDYFAANATCTVAKTYYKSCSICGAKNLTEKFEVGEVIGHTRGKFVSIKTSGNNLKAEYSCSKCNQKYESTTLIIYFENNWLWSDIHYYIWGTNGNNAWPGTSIGTKVGTNNENDVYKVEIDLTKQQNLIINGIKNDGSGNLDQTPDIILSEIEGDYIYMHWDNGNQVKYSTK